MKGRRRTASKDAFSLTMHGRSQRKRRTKDSALQAKFDRLAGPVTVRNINDAPDEGDNDRLN